MKKSISIRDTSKYGFLWKKINNLENDIIQIPKTKNNNIYLNALINNFLYSIDDIADYLSSMIDVSGCNWGYIIKVYQITKCKTVKQNQLYKSSIFLSFGDSTYCIPMFVDGNYVKDITFTDNVFKKRIQTKDSIKIILGVLKAKNPSTGSIVEYPFCDTVWVSH